MYSFILRTSGEMQKHTDYDTYKALEVYIPVQI